MARILNLFGRSVDIEKDAESETVERRPRKQSTDYDALGIDGADMETVENLAETQRSIEVSLSSVTGGLAEVQALTAHMATLQGNFTALFEDYRRSTLASLKLEQDRDRYSDQLREKSQEVEILRGESGTLRREVETARTSLARAQSDLEAFEKRTHLLEIAKKEVEQQLIMVSANLRAATEEAESSKLAVAPLRQQVEADAAKIGELSAKHHEVYEKSLLLAERCEKYESGLAALNDQISGLRSQLDSMTHERDNLQLYAQQKDIETSQLRGDLSRSFDKAQLELKSKDKEIADIRADNESHKSSAKIYEQVNLELKFDNEAKSAHIRQQHEMVAKLQLSISQLEAKVDRMTGELDAALSAKAQTDQSRAAMASRVESVAQALRAREADAFRLENELTSMTTQLEAQGARSRSTIDSLEARIFELEKELSAQRNETAYYYAQVEILKKPENRTPNTSD